MSWFAPLPILGEEIVRTAAVTAAERRSVFPAPSRRSAGRPALPGRAAPLKLAMLAALAVLPALFAGCGGRERAARPNVVVVVMDALRADHLGCYGYERPTSPRIDGFARTADRWTLAMAASPWTVPSHASLFTGRLPFEHGARTFETDRPGNNVNPLAPSRQTLAEALAAAGWRTGGFVANDAFLAPRWGLDQGFATWHVERIPGVDLDDRILAWIDGEADGSGGSGEAAGGEGAGEGAGDGRPFFLFVNFMDTHSPYNTTPRPELGLAEPAVRDEGELLRRLYEEVMPGEGPLPRELIAQVVDQYDTAVANVDLAVGKLLDGLRERGLLENTLVVLTSDHGEYFGEHHLVEHSKDVYQGALHVPLLVRSPGQREGRVLDRVVSSTDLPRLVLAACGERLERRWRDAFPDTPGSHPVIAENYYTRQRDLFDPRWGHRFRRVRTVLYEWPRKYIHSSDGRNELYDLSRDPGETRNLVGELPGVAAAARDTLRAFGRRRPAAFERVRQSQLTEEETRRLRALGYVQ